jgi:hypothetical protein
MGPVSCYTGSLGPPLFYFPVFFYFQRWKERERKREQHVEGKKKTDKNYALNNLIFD